MESLFLDGDKNMKVYITVCHDRHVDDDIKVHRTLPKARRYVEDWIKGYEGRYKWTREDDDTEDNWICTFDSDLDDGPRAHIEVSQLKK